MLKQLFTLLFIFITAGGIYAQKVVEPHYADTILFKSKAGKTEIVYKNATDTIPGFLYNAGKDGRLIFKRGLAKLNDSTYIIGADTLKIKAGSQVDLSPYYKRSQVDSTIAANKPDLSVYTSRQEVDTAKQHLRDAIAAKPDSLDLVIDNKTIIGDGSDANPLRVNDSLISASSHNADSLNHIAGNKYLLSKDTTGRWLSVPMLPVYLLPSVTTHRLTTDSLNSNLLYPPTPTIVDNLGITSTNNRSIQLRAPFAFTADGQSYVSMEIVPINNTVNFASMSNTHIAALRVGGDIVPRANNTSSLGEFGAMFFSAYVNLIYPNFIQAGSAGTLTFRNNNSQRIGYYSLYGNWMLGNPASIIKSELARLSIQGDQYATNLGRGIGIDDTLRAGKTGDTLVALDVAPVYNLSGTSAIATVTISGTTTAANGTYGIDFTGGSGSDARGLATVASGVVTLNIQVGGKNYKVGDVLTVSTTPGVTYTVTALGAVPGKVLAARFNNDINLNYTLPTAGSSYQLLAKDVTTGNIAQITSSSLNAAEYFDYQTGNYTLSTANGNVQNFVFQLSAAATLTLPSPATTLVVYISNMSNNQLTCSQNIYTDDNTWNTFITNQRLKLIWVPVRGKWYVVN